MRLVLLELHASSTHIVGALLPHPCLIRGRAIRCLSILLCLLAVNYVDGVQQMIVVFFIKDTM